MSEHIEYAVNETGLQITLPPEMGSRFFDPNERGNYLETVRYAEVQQKKRVVSINTSEEGITVDLNFARIRSLRAGQDRGNGLHQLATAHRQIVERASGLERNPVTEVHYTYGPVRAGVYGMAALLHWQPGDIENRFQLQQDVEADMQHAAGMLLPMTEEDIQNNVQAYFATNNAALIVNQAAISGMFSNPENNSSEHSFGLASLNIWNDAQQLVCLTGLASFARSRK